MVYSKNEVHHDNRLDEKQILVFPIVFDLFVSRPETFQTLVIF